jgi:hypothetical protein
MYVWKEKVDVGIPGNKKATVVVIYPDGSKEEVEVVISVVDCYICIWFSFTSNNFVTICNRINLRFIRRFFIYYRNNTNKPQVDPITDGDKIVTGKTEPNADVTVTLPDGSRLIHLTKQLHQ